MRIAFTHNIQLTNSEDEAEFDRPETVTAIMQALADLGHYVEPIDVAGPASRLVVRLEAMNPDLVFNTAEGSKGRFREAFYPALFDLLGLPFTFSDAYVCSLTLDKQLTKMLLARAGVPTPKWIFIQNLSEIDGVAKNNLQYPLMMKPNFEGSSMGITIDSVLENFEDLKTRVVPLLARFPAGLIIEEFIIGSDLTVPFLEKARPEYNGVLEPAQYRFDQKIAAGRKYQIYDYEMKSVLYDYVDIRVPADITPEQRENAIRMTQTVVRSLDIRDAARIDYRMAEDGRLYFIEVNALPSLEPGASIHLSAAHAGFDRMDKVMGAIVDSASERFGISHSIAKGLRRRAKVKVGLTFNLRRADSPRQDLIDADAEYDSPETVAAIREAIESYGHEVVELEATPELAAILPSSGVDVVFNIAEGIEGRTRESQIPAILELLGISYTGSDPTTLSLALDKGLAKKLANQSGIRTPPFVVMSSGRERVPKNLTYPVIVKPVAEGSSKGILKANVVENEDDLRSLVHDVTEKYRQPVIAESFLPGREFTVALLGEKRPRVLPPMEVIFPGDSHKYSIYSFESKFIDKNVSFKVPAEVLPALARELESVARSVFAVLGCRDLARVDMRLDDRGNVNFIECNPLPGLTPGFSDFCVIAEAAGIGYRALIGEILAPALRRMREKQKEKLIGLRA